MLQHRNTNMLPTMWAQKLYKLDDSKKISNFKKRGIGIEMEKICKQDRDKSIETS